MKPTRRVERYDFAAVDGGSAFYIEVVCDADGAPVDVHFPHGGETVGMHAVDLLRVGAILQALRWRAPGAGYVCSEHGFYEGSSCERCKPVPATVCAAEELPS